MPNASNDFTLTPYSPDAPELRLLLLLFTPQLQKINITPLLLLGVRVKTRSKSKNPKKISIAGSNQTRGIRRGRDGEK